MLLKSTRAENGKIKMEKSKSEIDLEILEFLRSHNEQRFNPSYIVENIGASAKLVKNHLKKLVARGLIHCEGGISGKVYFHGQQQIDKKRERKIKYIVLTFGILIAIVLGEILIRFYYKFYKDDIIGADEEELCNRKQYKMLLDTSNRGRYHPNELAHHEYWNYTGVRPMANFDADIIFTVTNDRKVRMYNDHTNSQHMRALRDYSLEKPPNVTRMVVLGDSFAWGDEAPLRFSMPYVLETLVDKSEVLNMAIRGAGIDVMYLRWRYDALNYKPDVVLYTIWIDDVQRISPCLRKPKFNIVKGKLVITNIPPPTLQEIQYTFKEPLVESYLYKHIVYNIRYWKGVDKARYDYGLKRLDLILDDMKKKSAEDDIYLLVVLITEANNILNPELIDDVTTEIKKMLREKNIPFVDSADIFAKEGYNLHEDDNQRSFDRDKINQHLTPRGYAYLAQGIKNKLEEDKVITKQSDFRFTLDNEHSILVMQNKKVPQEVRYIVPYDFIE